MLCVMLADSRLTFHDGSRERLTAFVELESANSGLRVSCLTAGVIFCRLRVSNGFESGREFSAGSSSLPDPQFERSISAEKERKNYESINPAKKGKSTICRLTCICLLCAFAASARRLPRRLLNKLQHRPGGRCALQQHHRRLQHGQR